MCKTNNNIETYPKMQHETIDLDTILTTEIGQFGRFQARTLALASLCAVFSAFHGEYVFTTARITTRCLISECEDATTTNFMPPWIYDAVPASGGSFDNCKRFENSTLFPESAGGSNDSCPAALFDRSSVRTCEKLLYEHKQTVVYDFELGCDEWRRTVIGSVRTLGTLAALPLTGYVSDRWGRRVALTLNAFNAAWLGLARYWADSYMSFTISEVMEAVLGSGVFSTIYILVLELVGPKYRVMAGATLSSCFSFGQVIMGLIAWAVPEWRKLTLALYIPQLTTICYFWAISESVRWYMSKGRYDESEMVLKKAARVNKRQLSDKALQMLRITAEDEKKKNALKTSDKKNDPWLIILVFRHKQILIRCMVLPVWWATMTLVYYGLSINAVNMSGNQYLNYIAVSAVEIPGFWISVTLLSTVGRRPVMMCAFWVCAASQLAYVFMPSHMYWLSLSVYLVGKCAISVVVTAIYVYSTELFPTEYRHNLFAFCSMIGRIGSITAPLTPAIGAATFYELPFVIFGAFALVSGFLVCFTPETFRAKLPDTMRQAEHLGNPSQ